MTPEQLFSYTVGFAQKSESSGRGTQYPTFRQAAKHFKVRLDDVESACEDWSGEGYMKPATGFRTYGGVGSFDNKGDWLVEAYK